MQGDSYWARLDEGRNKGCEETGAFSKMPGQNTEGSEVVGQDEEATS